MKRWLTALLVCGGFLIGEMSAQESKDKKDDEPKVYKGYLPSGWKALGLTDVQKQEVYKRQAGYKEKIAKLEAQIDDLKAKMNKDLLEVLTAEQKNRLREMALEKTAPKE